ncbi:Bifunctional inhibitor/plant lipid transfer protein/seed storage helical domain [Arabidopsis suecica]|uniref:Bifunctional inhibitor/plant lipid transfer protein/seed storage helical domain n=1 Tax=Arabidopsis suecica TaxID=45249 RepID=A0A8T2B759_ARASU|nr:Bifunctional inhibitor/plant lipid transfer protein/seed storage helical domain [Arabidopsis suecica]
MRDMNMMMKIYTIMFLLLVVRTSSFKPFPGCSQTKGYADLVYCSPSLRLNSPFIPPIPECCKNLKIDKMYCLCDAVKKPFLQVFDVTKIGKLSHACGDLLVPGSYCGLYKVPGGA